MPPAPAAARTSPPASSRSAGGHLAEHGAAGLSLRAVTRDLGMVSSAVYRYVARTATSCSPSLLVDAYAAQADAVDAAVAGRRRAVWHVRLLAAAHAFPGLGGAAEPSRYALLYGSHRCPGTPPRRR